MTNDDRRSAEVLLVEDSPTCVLITREAMRRAQMHASLSVVRDGLEAMQFLRREGRFVDAPRPDLILLDLNLPGKDGREVLAEVKADSDLRLIPVIALTSSKDDEDVTRAYALHANAYVVKPIDFEKFSEIVEAIEGFWLGAVNRPEQR